MGSRLERCSFYDFWLNFFTCFILGFELREVKEFYHAFPQLDAIFIKDARSKNDSWLDVEFEKRFSNVFLSILLSSISFHFSHLIFQIRH